MSKRSTGAYITVYFSDPVLNHLQELLAEAKTPIATYVRELVIETCPKDVQEQAAALAREASRKAEQYARKPQFETRPTKPPPPSFDDLVEANRDRVRDLEANGNSANAIAAILKLPYRVVQEILTTPAKPKKGRRPAG